MQVQKPSRDTKCNHGIIKKKGLSDQMFYFAFVPFDIFIIWLVSYLVFLCADVTEGIRDNVIKRVTGLRPERF